MNHETINEIINKKNIRNEFIDIELLDLSELFLRYTGHTYNINDLIKNCKTYEDKIKLYIRISWYLKRGSLIKKNKNIETLYYGGILAKLANSLDIIDNISSPNTDINKDNIINETDYKIINDYYHALYLIDKSIEENYYVEKEEDEFNILYDFDNVSQLTLNDIN